jgi:cold shock protein
LQHGVPTIASAVAILGGRLDPYSSAEATPVPAGRIKKIIPDRGFGFVRADDGNEVFFHRTELTLVDFDQLEEGQVVEFDIVDSPKGPRARNLRQAS